MLHIYRSYLQVGTAICNVMQRVVADMHMLYIYSHQSVFSTAICVAGGGVQGEHSSSGLARGMTCFSFVSRPPHRWRSAW
jgi:hypothetical protein